MNNSYIKFQKQRDFGDILNATFEFIKQEYKSFGKAILLYAGPFILMTGIVTAIFQTYFMNFQLNFLNAVNQFQYDSPYSIISEFFIYYVLIVFFSALSYTFLIGVIYNYIGLYVKKGKDNFELYDVWKLTSADFFKILGANIIVGIVVGVGTLFCCVPGIYLATSLSLILIVLIYERNGFGNAFNRSFELTHFQWWWTLLLVIVVYVIIAILSSLLSLPQAAISLFVSFNSINAQVEPSESMKITSIIITVLTTIVSYLLYTIPFVAMAFQYFNLVERKESPSLMKKIEEIGKDEENDL